VQIGKGNASELEQLMDENGILVAGPIPVCGESPVTLKLLIAVDAKNNIAVTNVNNKKHRNTTYLLDSNRLHVTGQDSSHCPIGLAQQKRTYFINANSYPLYPPVGLGYPNSTSHEKRTFKPCLTDWRKTITEEILIQRIKFHDELSCKGAAGDRFPPLEKKRTGGVAYSWWKLTRLHVEIDTNPENQVAETIGFGAHFVEQTRNLVTIDQ
jgi:hypothetical protein